MSGLSNEVITTWYLEMRSQQEMLPARVPHPLPLVMQAKRPLPMLSRFLYTAVGGHWYWRDRLAWNYAQWLAYLSRPEVQTWVCYVDGTPAGYIELEQQSEGNVEIAYFGLMREFIGQGLGGYLLGVGLENVWAIPGTQRVWVHTCSLDGPAALATYQKRGMTLYRTETTAISAPLGQADGPWPGWDQGSSHS